MMLPISMIGFHSVEDAPIGSIGWIPALSDGAVLICKTRAGKAAVCFGDKPPFAVALEDAWQHAAFEGFWPSAAFVSDIEFLVDPSSVRAFNDLENYARAGCLLFDKGKLGFAALSPNGQAVLLYQLYGDDGFVRSNAKAASRWKVVVRVEGEAVTLFERQ